MRYLLLSDIHANDVAFEAVLKDARLRRWEKVLFLGDLVGYYTGPERVTRMLMEVDPDVCLLGNHDELLLRIVAGESAGGGEDDVVSQVLERHAGEITSESLEFLGGFAARAEGSKWQAVHGSLRRPWEYLDTLQAAQANFPFLDRQICFVGHTHAPRLFASVTHEGGELWRSLAFKQRRATYRIPPRAKVFFNPGSVGQPRDGVPLASYAVYDDELALIEIYRVEFDLLAVQRSVRENDYPERLAARLPLGR